jgi:hypothetical protein
MPWPEDVPQARVVAAAGGVTRNTPGSVCVVKRASLTPKGSGKPFFFMTGFGGDPGRLSVIPGENGPEASPG